jgi:RNA 2',3'-cyclic 3'-phosphodiesterase
VDGWRLFVAIDLGEEARRALTGAQEAGRRAGLPVRWVAPGGAHLTLKFLGSTDRALVGPIGTALGAVAARHRPLSLRTGPPGAFPNPRRPRVLWLGLDGALDRLAALQGDVEDALADLGFPREARAFRPHLTLGRAREGAAWPGPDAFAAAFAGVPKVAAPLPVERIHLMRSELGPGGARYTTLHDAPLGAAQ